MSLIVMHELSSRADDVHNAMPRIRRHLIPISHHSTRSAKNNNIMSRIRHFARDVYANALYGWGASRLERIPAGKLLILTLHRILPLQLRDQYPLPGLAVTPDELRWVLACVARHFVVDTVSGALDRLRNGSSDKPLLAVSFDDGQLDNLEFGLPILEEFDIKASFYLPTDYIGGDHLLWHDAAAFAWQQLTQNISATHEFVREFRLVEPVGEQRTPDVESFLAALKRLSVARRAEILAALASRCPATPPEWARLMNWEEAGQLYR